MGRIAKNVIFSALLVAAGYFFGIACQKVGTEYPFIVSPSVETIPDAIGLVLFFICALMVVAIAAGMASVLLRPLWVCFIAFALSAAALFFAWGVGMVSAIGSAVYLVVGMIYARGVVQEQNNRIRFSVRPISESQGILILALTAIVSISFYVGYAEQIERQGFKMPAAFTDIALTTVKMQMTANSDVAPADVDNFLDQFKEQLQQQTEDMIEPYERFIPPVAAGGLFMSLWTVTRFLSWLPILILRALFPTFHALGITKIVRETQEIEKLVM